LTKSFYNNLKHFFVIAEYLFLHNCDEVI